MWCSILFEEDQSGTLASPGNGIRGMRGWEMTLHYR